MGDGRRSLMVTDKDITEAHLLLCDYFGIDKDRRISSLKITVEVGAPVTIETVEYAELRKE